MLTEEREELHRRAEALSTELHTLQVTFNSLVASVSDKDFELSALREQVTSLQKVVESGRGVGGHDDRHREEVNMLSSQLEGLRVQAQFLQQERDNTYLALQQVQAENAQLKNELSRLVDREQRLMKECERLRGHLVQIEDSYTREAVEAEEREKQLRNRLSIVEEKLASSSSAVHNVQLDSAKQVENLQIQLHTLAEQRDNALFQLSTAQETISSYASSLSNLQMVLEQFQAERQQQQSLEIERYRRDWQREHEEVERLQRQLRDMQMQLNEASDALEAAHRLSEQLDRKDSMIAALRDEVHVREAELAKTEEQVRRLTSTTESKIDKIIIKNLLLGYFHTPPAKRTEALQVIGQVLSYSRDEMKEIAALSAGSEGGWIGGLFRRKHSTSSSTSPSHHSSGSAPAAQATNPYHSFSELFVKFLERESSPQPTAVRLPAERMIQEQQEKHPRRAVTMTTPAFNPFSTAVLNPQYPVPINSSAGSGASVDIAAYLGATTADSHSLHPLMRPISPPRLPVFAPPVSSDHPSTESPSASLYSDTVRRDSSAADSSGRSTPSSMSAGTSLRDLLQQR
jgi:predicted  nucleic acid-binding Zn-ribbon protein